MRWSSRHFTSCATLPCTISSPTGRGGGSAGHSRTRPNSPKPASATAPPSIARRPSNGVAAMMTVASDSPCTPTQAAACTGKAPKAQTVPSRFHGKPVKAQPRSNSNSTQAPANTSTRGQPALTRQASAAGPATKTASGSASAGTAIGTSHQKRSTSVRMAWVSQ